MSYYTLAMAPLDSSTPLPIALLQSHRMANELRIESNAKVATALQRLIQLRDQELLDLIAPGIGREWLAQLLTSSGESPSAIYQIHLGVSDIGTDLDSIIQFYQNRHGAGLPLSEESRPPRLDRPHLVRDALAEANLAVNKAIFYYLDHWTNIAPLALSIASEQLGRIKSLPRHHLDSVARSGIPMFFIPAPSADTDPISAILTPAKS